MQIDTADAVLHRPTNETWLVAFVDGDRLTPCGWPLSQAALADCELVRAATDEQRIGLLKQMADMRDDNDPRCRHAKWRLGIRASDPTPREPT